MPYDILIYRFAFWPLRLTWPYGYLAMFITKSKVWHGAVALIISKRPHSRRSNTNVPILCTWWFICHYKSKPPKNTFPLCTIPSRDCDDHVWTQFFLLMRIVSIHLNYKLPSIIIGEEAMAKMLTQSKSENKSNCFVT
jgi:hypothetical protein